LLRAQHTAIDRNLHRHSSLALRLRTDVLDSETRLNVRLQYMQAWAAINGHPKADIENASDTLRTMYYDALNEVPYLTGGKSGTEVENAERMQAVQRYKAHRDQVLQPGSQAAPRPELPVAANKNRYIPV
jgi:hypothetical protein